MFIEIKDNLITLDDVSCVSLERYPLPTLKGIDASRNYQINVSFKSGVCLLVDYGENGELAEVHYNKIKGVLINNKKLHK